MEDSLGNQKSGQTPTYSWRVFGFLWGSILALGSFCLGAAGHGWGSTMPFGLLSIVVVPVTTVAWARRKTNGKKLAIIALVIALAADILLLKLTLQEGTKNVLDVLSMSIIWLALWISWQVLALAVLICKKK